MIGAIDPTRKKVKVIGAGISGLLIAYVLKKKGYSVEVLESSPRVGGLIQTVQTPFGPAEKAAHSLLVTPAIEAFFSEINVPLDAVDQHSKARFIVRNKKLRRLPLSFLELITTIVHFFSKPKTALNFDTATLAQWCEAYLGKPALRYLLSPFVTGVFAAAPSELNAKLSFPALIPNDHTQSLFQFFRSKPKKARPVMKAIRGGTEALVTRLADLLRNEIRLNHPINQFEFDQDTNWVFSIPAPNLAQLIEGEDASSASALKLVRYSPLITATVFYRSADFKTRPRATGFLIPREEGFRLLGCLYNSSSFPGRANAEFESFTAMVGGSSDPTALNLNDAEIRALITRELGFLLKTKSSPTHIEITRWDQAIPVYSTELKEAQRALRDHFCREKGRIVFTNYSKEVSIRSLIEAVLNL